MRFCAKSLRLLSFKIWTRDINVGAGRAARLGKNQNAENGVLRGRERAGTLEDEHNAIVEGDVWWTEEHEDEPRGTELGRWIMRQDTLGQSISFAWP